MMNKVVVAVVLMSVSVSAAFAEELTYADIVSKLTDVEALAVLPQESEACAQWSSYCRESRYDAESGKYIEWDNNGDSAGIIREENGQEVLAEMEGPGCIVRIWSAQPEQGHVRIYLDGASEPTIDMPFMSYFDHSQAPFNRAGLCYEVARGWNCFVPIPYQKSCKIVADKGWGRYYHFTYSTFPKGTVLPTFSMDMSAEDAAALDAVDKKVRSAGKEFRAVDGMQQIDKRVTVEPGQSVRVLELEGPAAIVGIRAKLDVAQDDSARAILRNLALRITWDDENEAAVWAPFGDFFGTAPGLNAYDSLVSGVTKEGLWYSHWYMPFAAKAVIEVINDNAAAHEIAFEFVHAPLSKPIESLGRFHAKWHKDAFLPAEPERAIDWTMLTTQGRGRYCGVVLNIWNPRGRWWGEGDEKFHVDGEKFPSTFGTGSEDYFGYAWCNPTLFSHAFHNQTISMQNKGHISVNRWHIIDNVPFQSSFEGYIEKYFPNERPTLYDACAYWYLAPGGRDPYTAVPAAERTEWPPAKPSFVAGAIEAETMTVIEATSGEYEPQDMMWTGDDWSRDTQLLWRTALGEKLTLALPVEQDGRYRIKAHVTNADDYSIIQFHLDGEKLGEPIDTYSERVSVSEFVLGEQNLTAGDNKLTIEVVGKNPKAEPEYVVGIDYVMLERIED